MEGTLRLYAVLWVELLLVHPVGDWDHAARRHPVFRVWDPPDEPITVGDVVTLGREFAAVFDWARIRAIVAERGWPHVCTAEEAAGFDDETLAGYVLARFPALDTLVPALPGRLRPSGARRVRAVLRAWDLV